MNEFLKQLTILIDRTGNFYSVLFSPAIIMSLARAANFVAGNLQSALNEGRAPSPSSHLTFNLFSVSKKMSE